MTFQAVSVQTIMYEGKNIHFSPLDNKPLCSYSVKVCKQRRLNGYALCLRHVLEDPGAPFRQCLHQARNKQQCTNPIHKNNDAQFCTSHLQLLGLLPVGQKSTSKANREGKGQIKNGLHNNSTGSSSEEPLRTKAKICDGAGLALNAAGANDPYIFSDGDPPKTSKCSTPLLSMAQEVGGLSNHVATIVKETSTAWSAIPSEQNRSIPISHLYPELVEKLESDRTKSEPRPKCSAGRSACSISSCLQTKSSQNRIKLKRPCSNEPTMTAATADETNLSPSSLSSFLCRPPVSVGLFPRASSSVKLDTMNERITTMCNSFAARNDAFLTQNPWMLPMFEPRQGVPLVEQTFSKALQGLLSSSPQVLSPTEGSRLNMAHPLALQAPLLWSRSELDSVGPPSQAVSTPSTGHRLIAGNLNLSSVSPGTFNQNHVAGSGNSALLSAALNLSPSTAATGCFNKTMTLPSASFEYAQSAGCSDPTLVHYVRPRSSAIHRLSESEARRKINGKAAMKIYLEHAASVRENSNLLPIGVDSSDDEDDDVDLELPWQRLWNDLSSDEGDGDFDLSDDIASNIRRTKLQLSKSKMRRQFFQLQRCHDGNATVRRRHRSFVNYLIASCRQNEQSTVEALQLIRNIKPNNPHRSKDPHLRKRPCLYRSDSDVACDSFALPYANHCQRHIMYNVDQLLFGYCTAKFADRTQCCIPVFDIKHDLPLCPDHLGKDGVDGNVEMKPKKQRKKTKPSALTRPPKKGKKKKCQRKTNEKPQKPTVCLNVCNATAADLVASMTSAVASCQPTKEAVMSSTESDGAVATETGEMLGTDVLLKDSMDDDGLGSDLDVTFSPTGLPLDNDQGGSFLDEHELHEMLNKMADEGFDLHSGKNGIYSTSKEAEDEFVRALVEVTKTFSESKDTRLEQLTKHNDDLELMPDVSNEDELTKQIADSLLNRSALSPSGSVSDDQDNFGDLASSLTVHDLKRISQVMMESSMAGLGSIDLGAIGMNVVNDSHQNQLNPAVGYPNGCGLFSPFGPPPPPPPPSSSSSSSSFSHKQPVNLGNFPPILEHLQKNSSDVNHVCLPGVVSFPLSICHSGMLSSDSSIRSSPQMATATAASRVPPSVFTSMFPLAFGVTASHVIVNGTTSSSSSSSQSRTVPLLSTTDATPAAYIGHQHPFQQSLPDIQTLMKQTPWRSLSAGDATATTSDIRHNVPLLLPSMPTSITSVPINFQNNPLFSYLSSPTNFSQPHFVSTTVNNECPLSSLLSKNSSSSLTFDNGSGGNIQTTRNVSLTEASRSDFLQTTSNCVRKIVNLQLPTTP